MDSSSSSGQLSQPSASTSSAQLSQPSASTSSARVPQPSGPLSQLPTPERICSASCRHVPPHRESLPAYCAPMPLPTALKKEELAEDQDDIVVLCVRGRAFDEAATRAHLLGRRRARSVPLPDTTASTDQQHPQQDGSTPHPSPKRSRASTPTSTTASPPRLAVDPPFDPRQLTSYQLRLSLIPFGPGSEVYGSAVTYLDLGTMAATVVPPPSPRRPQQQQQRPLQVRRDLFEETASAPGEFDREEDREEGAGPSTR
jgi:hypothetical protein